MVERIGWLLLVVRVVGDMEDTVRIVIPFDRAEFDYDMFIDKNRHFITWLNYIESHEMFAEYRQIEVVDFEEIDAVFALEGMTEWRK